jgi:hypothetical protein
VTPADAELQSLAADDDELVAASALLERGEAAQGHRTVEDQPEV